MEEWKDIEGYEGYYEISTLGNVRNVKTNHILTGDTNNIGYRRITLYVPKKKRFFIHRLVAKHFCEGYKEGLVVNHKDGNKLNNSKENLEWVTRSENDKHAYKLQLRKPNPCTFKHKIAGYDSASGELVKIFNDTEECSKELKVHRANIYNCCNGKQKSCRGLVLKYV